MGTATLEVSARVADGRERAAIWARQVERFPAMADYQAGISRRIPVVLLEPAAPSQ